MLQAPLPPREHKRGTRPLYILCQILCVSCPVLAPVIINCRFHFSAVQLTWHWSRSAAHSTRFCTFCCSICLGMMHTASLSEQELLHPLNGTSQVKTEALGHHPNVTSLGKLGHLFAHKPAMCTDALAP